MSLRQGVTYQEELKMKAMIAAGASWPEVAKVLNDVDYDYVKEHLYDPMAAQAVAADVGAPPASPASSKP